MQVQRYERVVYYAVYFSYSLARFETLRIKTKRFSDKL